MSNKNARAKVLPLPASPVEPAAIPIGPELSDVFAQVLSQNDVARAAILGILHGKELKSSYRLVISQAHLARIDPA